MKELVSIIVPVYNVEKYLERCIQSLVNQTYSELEIILVDDGSTDLSSKICDEWVKRDSRISVIHKKNGGLSDARNAGMKIVKGEYVCFVDSDDVVHKDFLKSLLILLNEYNADFVEGVAQKFTEKFDTSMDSEIEIEIYNRERAMLELIAERKIRQTVWNKLYRRELIEGIEFPYGKINEDEFWTYQVIGKVNTVVRTSQVIYGYFQRTGSIMGQNYCMKRLDVLQAKEERMQYIKKEFPDLYSNAKYDMFCTCRYAGQMILKSITDYSERKKALQQIKSVYQENELKYYEMEEKKWSEIIWLLLFNVDIEICCKIRNVLRIGM